MAVKRRIHIFILALIVAGVILFQWRNDKVVPVKETKTLSKKLGDVNNSIGISQIKRDTENRVNKILYFNGEKKVFLDAGENHNEGVVIEKRLGEDKVQRFLFEKNDLKSSNLENAAGFSKNGEFLECTNKGGKIIYDLKNQESKLYSSQGVMARWTEDSSAILRLSFSGEKEGQKNGFMIYNENGELLKEKMFSVEDYEIDKGKKIYSENGEVLYFIGKRFEKTESFYGIYVYDFSEDKFHKKYERSLSNKGKNPLIFDYNILRNQDIIFSARLEDEVGLYYLDHESGEVSELLSQGRKIDFKSSPDEEKIVFSIEKETGKESIKKSTYVGLLRDKELKDITFILRGGYSESYAWGNESKRLLFIDKDKGEMVTINFK